MARVKRGNVARKRRNKILRLARGFRGGNGSLFRTANQRVMKALCNAYRDRRRRLIGGLKKADVQLNRKMLAQLAVLDPGSFSAVVGTAKG
jgi:large subunit ribosomal protein L20